MYKNAYYGTSTNRIGLLAESGIEKDDLAKSKVQARLQAERQAKMDGGKPVLLKIILDNPIQCDEKIKPNRILVCE